MRPLQHEIDSVYICGDGRKFLDEKEAKDYQSKLEFEEQRKMLRLDILRKEKEVKKLKKEFIIDKCKSK